MSDDSPDGRGPRPAADLAASVGEDVGLDPSVVVRPYDPDRAGDPAALWERKAAFERELGGDDQEKAAAYEAKLDDDYRRRYLAWVERCVAEGPAVWLAVDRSGDTVIGYAFLLPERLAMIWDGAVLNELYVDPSRRGTGVADALVGAVVERARAQATPMDRLLLDVAPTNERARAFYERHDFEPWGEMVARDLQDG